MSNKWIIDRLDDAVGCDKALNIKKEMILNPDNVGYRLIQVKQNGSIKEIILINGVKQK